MVENIWMILGYDIRESHSNDIQKISADPNVLPESNMIDAEIRNYMGFISDLMQARDAFSKTRNQILIALSCDPFIHELFSTRFCCSSLDDINSLSSDWVFCGYDIVELNGLYSGIFGVTTAIEKESGIYEVLNGYGLFDDCGTARRYAELRSFEVMSHSPFTTIGIYKR